ncbi:MAG: type II secretion system protein [Rhodoferax sp.]
MSWLSERSSRRVQRGFTLVEIAVVLVIIGIILGGVLNARSIMRNASVKDVARAVGDIATAAQQFKGRYGVWPGDLPNANTVIPDVSAACNGNANLVIEPAEVACATEELIRASMVRGDVGGPLRINGTHTVTLISRASAAALPGLGGLPTGWGNVVRIANRLDCDMVIQVDRILDDGGPTTGNFRAGTACPGQDENTIVDNAVLRLN